jgi:hypothetical protein
MDDPITVYLIGGEDGEQATFTLHDQADECRLRCAVRGTIMESTASDYFQALCIVRERLFQDGLIPFCYGASLNVYPSGMARDMGQGLKAYKTTFGTPARSADLVGIFGEGADVIPASVEAQEKHFRDWIASLRA